MKDKRDEEWFYEIITKMFLSVPVTGIGFGVVKLYGFLLYAVDSIFLKAVISVPAILMIISIAILLYELWRGDFTNYN